MRVFSSRNIQRSGMALAMALTVGLNTASAGTNTGVLSVTASVAAVCIIGNATLAFGAYNPTSGTVVTGNTTVTLTCTLSTPYNIGMSPGASTGATVSARAMTVTGGGSSTLGYQLCRNSGCTLNWGQTVNTDTLAGTSSATSLTNSVTIYGQIPASEAVPIGSYSDTVTMTVTF